MKSWFSAFIGKPAFMLPLHTTFNILVTFSVVTILISCSDRSKTDIEVIKALDESLVNSNKAIEGSISDIMASLQDKLNDRSTAEKAQVWYPKAQLIQKISKNAIDDIERITIGMDREQKKIFDNDSMGLYEMMINYKNNLLQVDPALAKEFKNSLKVFTQSLDSSKHNQKGLFKNYFDGVSIVGAKAMLNKLQNNIRINEERTITYCYEHSIRMCGIYYVDFPLAIQSSTITQPGEYIEITAGLASFAVQQTPKVYIYGKEVPLGYDLAVYKLKTASKPGKYYVPIKINYTDQNGVKQSIQKKIEYTVANIQEQ